MKDWCTGFPEYWIRYKWRGFTKLPFEVVYIGNICEKHDEACSSHTFYKDLWKARIVGAVSIATIASIACWVKYTRHMIKRV